MPRVQRRTLAPPCPDCFAADVRRSRLRRLDHLTLRLPIRPYRCLVCDRRFWWLGWWLRAR